MAADDDFYDLAVRFPLAALHLAGLRPTGDYEADSVEVKVARRIDGVFRPSSAGDPVVIAEMLGYGYPDAEWNLLEKVILYQKKDPAARRRIVPVIYYTTAKLAAKARVVELWEPGLLEFAPRRLVLPDLRPDALEEVGGDALVALPLTGSAQEVRARLPKWRDAVLAAQRDPERRVLAEDLFLRFAAQRLDTMDVAELFSAKEETVEDTATGRALIAKGVVQGELRLVTRLLERRLGVRAAELAPRLAACDAGTLERVHDLLVDPGALDLEAELDALLPEEARRGGRSADA